MNARSFAKSVVCLLLAAAGYGAWADTILNSKHNLSISSPGDIRATTETEVCIFCHTPHQAIGDAPLWNRQLPPQQYTPYASTTLKATVGQPTGSSKLCLSCHDGTIALGMVNSRTTPIPLQGGVTTLPARRTRIGTDLSDDHPVSFRYDAALVAANPDLNDPSSLNQRVRLDANREMQCTSCHDPHNNEFGKFLVQDNSGSALCVQCHAPKRWNESIHKLSNATWNGQGQNPWPHSNRKTVSENACENCHASHQAGTKPRLLKWSVAEQNCFTCHDGNVAAANMQLEFNKPSVHPVLTSGDLHDEAEDLMNPPRHVTCVDCHNPHAVQASPPNTLHAPGSLVGVKGVTAIGTMADPVVKESELCYRCHGDSTARKNSSVRRQISETNKRVQFAPANASFHPLEAVGRNGDVPSLITPWTISSKMSCADCHNNDQGPGAGGVGPRGPHGSTYSPLLERQCQVTDFSGESPGTYALCYKCHSRDSILGDVSFRATDSQGRDRGHRYHIVDAQAACTTCHDSHGVASASTTTSSRLMNFNTLYVSAGSNGRLEYNNTGTRSGNCSLTCHGADHAASAYSSFSAISPLRTLPKSMIVPKKK
jgi:predicted CXXCH cytochrome family protein